MLIALGCTLLGVCVQKVLADDYFNPALLDIDNPGQGKTDLSIYEIGPGQAPGKYHVDVYVNNNKVASKEIEFTLKKDASGKSTLQPCLSAAQLKSFGINTEKFGQDDKAQCIDLSVIPSASATFHVNPQQLLLSIPQTAITQVPRDYVDPQEYDEGINALLLNYSFTAGNNRGKGENGSDQRSEFLNLRPGLNLGAWRFRNYSTWSKTSGDGDAESQFSSVYTYAQRDIIALGGNVTFGQSSSPSDVFDSISYTGAQIASDDDMLPDSMKGFAPVIRGTAHSNAQVIVRQNGYVIYQNYVAPGAFEINDLYPTGGSGDLNVTVKETDGSEQHFVVPYASVPVLQREGRFKYSLTAGRYRSYDNDVEKPRLCRVRQSTDCLTALQSTAACRQASITMRWRWGSARISAISGPFRWMSPTPNQRCRIRIPPAGAPGASATAKISPPPVPIFPLLAIAITARGSTPCRTRWIPIPVMTTGKRRTRAAAARRRLSTSPWAGRLVP